MQTKPPNMRTLTLLLFLTYNTNTLAQILRTSDKYSQYTNTADSLLKNGNYEQAITNYQHAAQDFNGRLTQPDQYNYTKALSLSGNADSTIQNLKKLCTPGRYWDYPTLLKDPAFDKVKTHPGFTEAIDCMKANKEKYAPNFNYEWRDMLDALLARDQAIRRELTTAQKSKADPKTIQAILERMHAIDTTNVATIDTLLEKNGLPGFDIVDLRGVSTIITVLLHSPVNIQLKHLPKVREAVKRKKAMAWELAMLEDKALVGQNEPQIYGSQTTVDETGKPTVWPIKDEATVNKRRAAVGLDPLEQYLKLFGITYTPKN